MKNWIRSLVSIGAVCGVVLGPWSEADAALNAYLKLKGQKQGDIKGSVVRKGQEGAIAVIAVSHEIISPRDPASGLATGKRQHKPFTFTKELDRSTPQLYKALVTGEVLPEVELVVFSSSDKQSKTPIYTVKLSNATISEIRFVTPKDGPEAHEISLTYQKITWTWVEGNITADDDWEAPIAKPAPAPAPKPMPKK